MCVKYGVVDLLAYSLDDQQSIFSINLQYGDNTYCIICCNGSDIIRRA